MDLTDLQYRQLLADIDLKQKQSKTEFWKVLLQGLTSFAAVFAAGAAVGHFFIH